MSTRSILVAWTLVCASLVAQNEEPLAIRAGQATEQDKPSESPPEWERARYPAAPRIELLPGGRARLTLIVDREEHVPFKRTTKGGTLLNVVPVGESEDDEANALNVPQKSGGLRYLLNTIAKNHPGVDTPVVRDRFEVTSRGANTDTSRVRELEVSGPVAEIQEIQEYCLRFAKVQQSQIMFSLRFVTRPDAEEREADGKVTLLDSAALASVLREIETSKSEVVVAPKVLTLSGQRATISILNQLAYIKDFEVRTVRDTSIADPIIDVVQEGMAFHVEAIAMPDSKAAQVSVRLDTATLLRPIQEVETNLLGSKVTVQLPEVHRTSHRWDDLLVDEKTVGFVAKGLRTFRQKDDGSVELAICDVVCHVEILNSQEAARATRPAGKVLGFDRSQGLVFSQFDAGSPDVGQELHFERNGIETGGTATVVEARGTVVILKLLKGTPEAGDLLR